jgi:serine/threonine-protein kinase RsbW
MEKPKNKMEISITSDTLNLEIVENFIREMFLKYNIDKGLFTKVLICVNEAVVNSIEHGNKFDKKKIVVIKSYYCHNYLYFKIIDEGEGFDYKEIIDPTSDDNIFKESGRGIYIIKNMSDAIVFRSTGNIVEFKVKSDEQN